MSKAMTISSLARQRGFEWIVLLHRDDPLIEERRRAFAGATFIYTDLDGSPSDVAWLAYGADWRRAIGGRDGTIAMTRLDDDDALAPWIMERTREVAAKIDRRTILMCPNGIRVWQGGYAAVRHHSNAMHTLVTPPGDTLTVYDYGHRDVRRVATVRNMDFRVGWLWVRHPDTISGWRTSDQPLTPEIRSLFEVDWSVLKQPFTQERLRPAGHVFR